MRAVVQRVAEAKVEVDNAVAGKIGRGLLIFIGIETGDVQKDIETIVDKCVNLRIFDDPNGVMNVSALEAGAELLVVSQFTIMGDVRHGRRPSYTKAAPPEGAKIIFADTLLRFQETGLRFVRTGRFAADMQVSLVNDGPVTILLDSKKVF